MERSEAIRRMRADHSERSRALAKLDGFPITGPWSFRETCEHDHGWSEIGGQWLQCTRCWWCKPMLGTPPKLEQLPAILKGRVLPPLSGRIDLQKLYANAGFIIDDDRESVLSAVRVVVVQYTFTSESNIRRCGASVRFKGRGWREAAVFMETWMSRLMTTLSKAEPRKPKALWRSIQKTMEQSWPPPWERESWQ